MSKSVLVTYILPVYAYAYTKESEIAASLFACPGERVCLWTRQSRNGNESLLSAADAAVGLKTSYSRWLLLMYSIFLHHFLTAVSCISFYGRFLLSLLKCIHFDYVESSPFSLTLSLSPSLSLSLSLSQHLPPILRAVLLLGGISTPKSACQEHFLVKPENAATKW